MELAEEVYEEEFRVKYMPEDRGSDMTINFISTEADSRDKVNTKEEVNKKFDTIEIKGVFPPLLNFKDGKVGQAKNCAHETHLTPGTVPVKRVPVHIRDELKSSRVDVLAQCWRAVLFGNVNQSGLNQKCKCERNTDLG